jgi:GNAT superfamily N-acetyltransferase
MSADSYHLIEDVAQMPFAAIHRFLSQEAYWCKGIPESVLTRAMENSLCVAVLHETELAAFARVVTDRATFAYLCDVFVLPAHRQRGLSRRMLDHLAAHPDLQGLRRQMLMTADAHALYQQFGYTALKAPERAMEIHVPNAYQTSATTMPETPHG